MRNDPILSVENLKTAFYLSDRIIYAVDGVSFTTRQQEILGIVGETGCGKTVLGRTIMRLIQEPPGKILGGRIIFKKIDILQQNKKELRKLRGSEISMIFQEPGAALDPCFTVGSQISEAIRTHQKTNKAETWELVLEILSKVGIPDPKRIANECPHHLSGGMKQRIMIAIALSCHPTFLIADEPTTSLDITIQLQILRLLHKLKDEMGTTIILISHDMSVIAEMCDRVAVMYMGEIVELRDIFSFFKDPLHPYSVSLLKSIPSLEDSRINLEVIKGNIENYTHTNNQCKFFTRCDSAIALCKKVRPTKKAVEGGFVSCHLI